MPADPRDYKLELSGAPTGRKATGASRPPARPFLRVYFACCNVYQRIYRSPDGTRYEAACPRCARRARFVVGPGGTNCRAFVIS
ncbi:MAG: hypothetical protein NZ561_08025 [Phycisphaerae bacterium]|nr:hypothetical protein [Phycisphaerae bacterium]